jgi:hypothetical protein
LGNLTVLALRVLLGILLAATLFVQTVMVPLVDVDADLTDRDIPLRVLAVLGAAAVQIIGVCVWRLVTMVRGGTVFSDRSFRYVDGVIAALTAGALLMFVLAGVVAPGEAVAPGVVLFLGAGGVAVLGVALLVVVLRTLLAQAVARDLEAIQMQAELDAVI